jgi:hypothetical protein
MILFSLALVALVAVGCADKHALTYTSVSAPIWNINPTKWDGGGNTLTTTPTLPSGIQPQAGR